MTNLIQMERYAGRDPMESLELNFKFVGQPGTGKTTVAEKMGKLLNALGLPISAEVVNKTVPDFVTGYANQAGKKTKQIMKDAVGKVLFIDEAYMLGGSNMEEVVDTITAYLTHVDTKGKLVVILAGYKDDIDGMLVNNQGLESRFTREITFEPFSVQDSSALLRSKLRKAETELSEEADRMLDEQIGALMAAAGRKWGNGRDIETLAKRLRMSTATRFSIKTPNVCVIPSDVETEVTRMVARFEQLAESEQQQKPGTGIFEFEHKKKRQAKKSIAVTEEKEEECGECAAEASASAPQLPPGWAALFSSAGLATDDGVELLMGLASEANRESALQELREQIHQEELRKELERMLREEAERLRQWQEEERQRLEEILRKAEEERQLEEAEREKEERRQKALQTMGVCCMGFRWILRGDHYQCSAGGHTVPLADVDRHAGV